MARKAFNTEDYDTFCHENGFITKKGCKRYTAEILFKFLSNDLNFEEEHTGLADVMIEKEIFAECMRRGVTNGKLWE